MCPPPPKSEYVEHQQLKNSTTVCYRTTELQNRIADQCVQLHGGWGYMWEYPIAKAFVDAKPQTIYGGSNEIMKELIVRSIVRD